MYCGRIMPFQTKYTVNVQVVDNSHCNLLLLFLMYMWYILKAWLKYSILDDRLARVCSSCAAHHVSFTGSRTSQKYAGVYYYKILIYYVA